MDDKSFAIKLDSKVVVGKRGLLVEDALQSAHLALDDVLRLLRQLGFDVLLETSQKEGPKYFVQTTNNQNRFFLVQLNLDFSRRD